MKSTSKKHFAICVAMGLAVAINSQTCLAQDDEVTSQAIDFEGLKVNPTRLLVQLSDDSPAKANIESSLQSSIPVEVTDARTYSAAGDVSVIDVKYPLTAAQLKRVIKALTARPDVLYAEPDYLVSLVGPSGAQTGLATIPNDNYFGELWGLNNNGQTGGTPDADIDAPEAWDVATSANGIVVGVIDTGVDFNHPDLRDNMWTNPGEIPGNRIDDDLNGYVDDIHGIDCIHPLLSPIDLNGHGTHVSGTIAANGNNAIGVSGVSWDAKIMALKFLSFSGNGRTSDAIRCLNYAVSQKNAGVDIRLTSNSWGGGGYSQALFNAIRISEEAGMLFIAAAGNSSSDNDSDPHYPSNYQNANVISVASTDHFDQLSSFSNYGASSVDLAAPGSAILSTVPTYLTDSLYPGYDVYSGTSMATPHVAGAAALLWGQNPSASAADIKSLILDTIDSLPELTGLVVSGGRLNLNNAITCDPESPQLRTSLSQGFQIERAQPLVFTARLSACGTRNRGIAWSISNGAIHSMRDDGIAPDKVANDGTYSGTWTPGRVGPARIKLVLVQNGIKYSELFEGEIVRPTGYTYNDTEPFLWDDISGIGTPLSLSDDSYARVSLPFPITFYGNEYSEISISANGAVYFADSAIDYVNQPIPEQVPSGIETFAALFWDDLNPEEGGEVYWAARTQEGNERVIVQYQNVPLYGGSGGEGSFQIIFYPGTGNIKMQYQDVYFDGSSSDLGGSATVGLQQASDKGTQYSYDSQVLRDGMAILWRPER